MPLSLKNKADTLIGDLRIALEPIQTSYRVVNRKYWQGLSTSSAIPKDGIEVETERNKHPSDQIETWEDVGVLVPSMMPVSLEIHTYDGPQGQGYVIIASVEIAGRRWVRSVNVGMESWRMQPWQVSEVVIE